MITDLHMHPMPTGYFQASDIPAGCSRLHAYPISQHLDQLSAIDHVGLIVLQPLSFSTDPEMILSSVSEAEAWARAQEHHIIVRAVVAAEAALANPNVLQQAGIIGVRFMPGARSPESLKTEIDFGSQAWIDLCKALNNNGQQLHLQIANAASFQLILDMLHDQLPILLDHLAAVGVNDSKNTAFNAIVNLAAQRGQVYFKGPGFRSAIQPEDVIPMTTHIVECCGPQALLLGATDAPFVWNAPHSETPLQELIPDAAWAYRFTQRLAELTAQQTNAEANDFLSNNALKVFNP